MDCHRYLGGMWRQVIFVSRHEDLPLRPVSHYRTAPASFFACELYNTRRPTLGFEIGNLPLIPHWSSAAKKALVTARRTATRKQRPQATARRRRPSCRPAAPRWARCRPAAPLSVGCLDVHRLWLRLGSAWFLQPVLSLSVLSLLRFDCSFGFLSSPRFVYLSATPTA